METIQVVLDSKLLKEANQAAKKQKVNRSALIRTALADHLKRLHIRELDDQERKAYRAKPQQPDEYLPWAEIAVWPED